MEISVCLIVKNEEDVIDRCLKCVCQFADEVIIVDTGSTDKTKKIVKKYTKNIFDFIWNDNFADARNFSFSKATKDYVMWIDADDIITDKEVEKISNLKQNMLADTYMLKYAISFDSKNNPIFSYYRERILKNNKNAKWEGFVHEAISPFGKIEYIDITIEHRKQKSLDPKRNLKIYEKHLKYGEKLSARAQYYYCKELFYNSMYKKCIAEIKKYFTLPNQFEPNLLDAYLTIGKCYSFLNNKDKALDYLLSCLKFVPPSSELLCEIGNTFITKLNYKQAIFFYECALNVTPNYQSGQFIDKNYYYLYPHLQLTMLYYKIGNYEKAKIHHLLSKSCNPTNSSVLFNEQFFK